MNKGLEISAEMYLRTSDKLQSINVRINKILILNRVIQNFKELKRQQKIQYQKFLLVSGV